MILEGGQVVCHRYGYSLTKAASERDKIRRLCSVTNLVIGALRRHGVAQVGIENYGFASKTLAFSAELGGSVKVQLWAGLKIMPILIPCSSVRKYLLGHNTKDKNIVRKHLASLGYGQPTNTDESDALAVALVANDYFNTRSQVTEVERMDLFERFDKQRS